MISKSKIKFIVSLRKKEVRDKEHLYLIEGDKLIKEFISAGKTIRILAGKAGLIDLFTDCQRNQISDIEILNEEELKRISTLTTPHNAVAVVPFPDENESHADIFGSLSVALEFVQDPGNLGTIIRAAAWFGIKNIICSENCVDVYNPKVVQASMGALLNVNVSYRNLEDFLTSAREKSLEVYGTMTDGESIYLTRLNMKGVVVLGNESKGISSSLLPFITKKLAIPRFAPFIPGIDSLNVAMAASIVLSEFARRT